MFRNISVIGRIVIVITVLLLTIFALVGAFYFNSIAIQRNALAEIERLMVQGQEEKVRLGTETMAVALGATLKGVTDRVEQHDIIKSFIQDYRFEEDKSGYYFTYIGTTIFMHPTLPQREGEDLANTPDADGVFYVRNLYEAANKGGGFVYFSFPKPGLLDANGEMMNAPKLAYSMFIPGTDIWISTGIYIDNIDATLAAISTKEMGELKKNMAITIGLVAAMVIFILLPICVLLLRSITAPLHETVKLLADIDNSGDLRIRTKDNAKDEIGKMSLTFNQMMDKMQSCVLAVNERVALMNQQISSLSESAENVSRDSQSQSSAASSIAASIEQLTSGISTISDNVGNAKELAISMGAASSEGSSIIDKTSKEMDIMVEVVSKTSTIIKEMGENSKQIGEIVQVINDVADQTNLLALNAAIEAARAGESGRGFAVVADEVRKLAERTTGSLGDITKVISKIQSTTNEALVDIGNVVTQVEQGQKMTKEAGEKISTIERQAINVSAAIDKILDELREQKSANHEISLNMDNIAQMTAHNSEVADIVAKDATRLDQLSQEVTAKLGVFRV